MAPYGTLSTRRQCELLAVPRSSVYYEPVAPDAEELALMRRIDELHLQHPFFGSRMITQTLKAASTVINRKRVQRLMRVMGLESTAPKPQTSTPAPDHPVYPYLLRGLAIARPNQVWATDITYIPMARGFAYLVAIIDWYSRRVLAWRLSNTLDTGFCLEALRDALTRFGRPTIFNTDQGSQFTAGDFTRALRDREIKISMDGKGRYLDNIFVERLWRSLKSEEIYLHPYDSLTEAREESGATSASTMTRDRIRRWAIRRRPRSTTRRRGAPPHERACRLGAGCRCARPPPGSPLRSDPAPRGAGGDLDPVSAHRRGAITGSRPRPATQLARHDHDENRPGRLHLSKARFWSERWGPPHSLGTSSAGSSH